MTLIRRHVTVILIESPPALTEQSDNVTANYFRALFLANGTAHEVFVVQPLFPFYSIPFHRLTAFSCQERAQRHRMSRVTCFENCSIRRFVIFVSLSRASERASVRACVLACVRTCVHDRRVVAGTGVEWQKYSGKLIRSLLIRCYWPRVGLNFRTRTQLHVGTFLLKWQTVAIQSRGARDSR